MRCTLVAACLAGLALAGCGTSPTTRYHALAVVPGTGGKTASLSLPVTVAAVHIPPALDRRGMVRRTGETAVEVSSRDRWAAPLGAMAREVLAEDLASRLPDNQVVLPSAPIPRQTERIVVSIAQFGADETGHAILHGSWSLLRAGAAKPHLSRPIALETTVSGTGADAEAVAMSQLLGQLATEMARTLASNP